MNDNDDRFYKLTPETVGSLEDVEYNKSDNYIRFDFSTTYGKKLASIFELSKFLEWLREKKKNPSFPQETVTTNSKDIFIQFIKDYLTQSKESNPEPVTEIIDDHGNIVPDGEGMPTNSTNTMIGANHVWDLEKIFQRSMPKSVRNYSGNLGMGSVVW
jgi:hypothetical protein